MRAVHFNGTAARLVERAEPTLCDETVIVRVTKAGICRTDLELTRGYMDFRGILGHEFVGQVCEGPAEWRGQRVVGEINFACGACPLCQVGLPRHCPSRQVMGIAGADGTFAEFVRVPIANLHSVPPSVSDDAAVFCEPLAAAFEILSQIDIDPGVECTVMGDGKLGLLVAQVLQSAGARVLPWATTRRSCPFSRSGTSKPGSPATGTARHGRWWSRPRAAPRASSAPWPRHFRAEPWC